MEKIDIINAMLAAVGSNGVSSTEGRHPALIKAKPILTRVNKQIQTAGHWFNTDLGYELLPSAPSGEFIIPTLTLKCTPTDKKSVYVRRGTRMYDPTKQTYAIDETSIKVDVVLQLSYDSLPFTALEYIRATAGRQMILNSEAAAIMLSESNRDMELARLEFNKEKRGQRNTSLRDNPEYAYIMGGLPHIHGTSRNASRIGG